MGGHLCVPVLLCAYVGRHVRRILLRSKRLSVDLWALALPLPLLLLPTPLAAFLIATLYIRFYLTRYGWLRC